MSRNFFIDFDGTITEQDVVFTMIKTFCREGWQEINGRWERGEISTEQCAQETFNLMSAGREDILNLASAIKIDPYFPEFLRLCRQNKENVVILSDGYDLIIAHILKKAGIELPFYANRLLVEGNRFSIACTHHNKDCGRCGTCKTGLLHRLKEKNSRTVFVGDGYSDTCVAREADIILAKEPLLGYCLNNDIPALPINNFSDVIKLLPEL
jgi:2,3-diketo-5-methylthio-1-phosphopentane phosphatase